MRPRLTRLAIAGLATVTSLALMVNPAMAEPTPAPTPVETTSPLPVDSPAPASAEPTTSTPAPTETTTPASVESPAPVESPVDPATSASTAEPTPTPEPSPEPTAADPEVVTHGSVTSTTFAFGAAPMRPSQVGQAKLLGLVAPTETTGFSLVGITWDAKAGDGHRFEVRVRNAGAWSEWYALEPALSDATGTDPIWVGEADAVEAQVLGNDDASITGLNLVLIDPEVLPTDQEIARDQISARAELGPVAQPTIVTRTQWNAYAPQGCEANSDTIKAVTVHHTAGSNVYTAAQAPGIVRGIQSYHEFTLGWCDIGYNFLIDKYGTIYEGKSGGIRLPVHGAHATSWNDDTVGISFMMNSDSLDPNEATMEAAARLLAWKMAGYYLDPKGRVTLVGKNIDTIFRHGDVMATACPGAHITSKMGWLRDRVASLMNSSTVETPIYQAWQATGGASGPYGVPVMMEAATPNGGRSAGFQGGGFFQASPTAPILTVVGIHWETYVETGWDSPLGFPTGNAYVIAGGTQQDFVGGEIYNNSKAGAWSVRGGMLTHYRQRGESGGVLGFPISHEFGVRAGAQQNFQGGVLVWTAASGAIEVLGKIGERYRLAGGANGYLGAPLGPEQAIVGGKLQRFERGVIYLANGAEQAYSVHGGIATFYDQVGAYAGYLGFPTSGEQSVRDGVVQTFQNGSIYWTAAGAFTVHGGVGAVYAGAGGPTGVLGLPISPEIASGGRVLQRFQYGNIYWTPTDARTVHGGIFTRYKLADAETGYLRYPVGPEEVIAGGVQQRFERGVIYWSAKTGAYSVHGGIADRYNAANGPAGYLGFPKSTELAVAGGVVQQFEHGNIYWSAQTASYSVHGGIDVAYQAVGGPAGALGFPTSTEQSSGAGVIQHFQGGSITWTAADGPKVNIPPTTVPLTKVDTFINAVAPMAQRSAELYGVPASVTLAQAILESAWGESELSRYGQAFFGVKCNSTSYSPYTTGCMPKLTWEVIGGQNVYVWAHFRSYSSLTDSVLDHGYFLRNNTRYAPAFNTSTPEDFAKAIAAAGYATDPAYASKLSSLINTYNLKRFDVGVRAGVVPVAGAIGEKYAELGGVTGQLGSAIGIEADGPTSGGRMVSFNSGMIAYSPATGAHAMVGSVWDRYRLEKPVRDALGLVSSDPFAVGSRSAGQLFQRGGLYATPTGTHMVFGGIWTAYQGAGAHGGALGAPKTGEQAYGSGVIQYFDGGSITWTAAEGAVVRPG